MRNIFLSLITLVLFLGCTKETINVSAIHFTDNVGNPLGGAQPDNQWKALEFTAKEMELFKPLDTANLTGSTKPTITNSYNAYPNPFQHEFRIYTAVLQPAGNSIVAKYVIVNKKMDVVRRGVLRVPVTNGINMQILADFTPGKYRIYFTYSAEGHPHFLKSWGNIQKKS